MLSDPRSIAFVAELVHPGLRHRPEALQGLYGRLVKERGLSYANFNLQPGGAHMTTVHGQAQGGELSMSSLVFLPDRVAVREEWPRLSLDDFLDRTVRAVRLAMQELGIPAFTVVHSTVRCLVDGRGIDDTRLFLRELLDCKEPQDFSGFGREPNLVGLRMAFPAGGGDLAAHNVRIESYGRDPRSFFLEETQVTGTRITADGVEELDRVFRRAYDFVTDEVAAWLAARGAQD